MEKTLSSQQIYDGRAVKLRVDTVTKSNGKTTTREVVEHSDCVAVVVLDSKDNAILVRQFRKAVGKAPLILPTTTILGDDVAFITEDWDTEEKLKMRPHVRDGAYLKRIEKLGLYTEDKSAIASRIKENGLMNVLNENIMP